MKSFIELGQYLADNDKQTAHLQDDLSLTKNQYNNFNKLKYFGLVIKESNGRWGIDVDGWGFLSGAMRAHKKVRTFRNKVVETSEETVGIEDFRDLPDMYSKGEENFMIEEPDLNKINMIKDNERDE